MTEIPGYKIRRELGHGGMATVFLAVQESLDRSVALKVMAPTLAADRTFTQRFIKEGKTIAKFNHPHIVGVYDVGVADQHHYIAMEHVSGGDLKRKLKSQGAFDPEEALEILKFVGSALGYAHKQGFIHRDVKSENILFREDGSAVLTDFGIAKAADSATKMTGTGMSIGTPHYMSPEQARGKEVDGRSDIYSLGIVLYEMLTGRVPYEADDSVAIGIMHVSKPVPTLPEDLSEYDPLLKKMLAKDPNERYQTAEQLIQAINDLLMVRRRTTEPNETVAATPRSRWLFWGAFIGALTIGMGIGYFALQPEGTVVEVVGGGKTRIIDKPQDKPASAAALPEGDAILQVVTRPEGVEVFLDGHLLGVTPLVSAKLPSGRHTLELKHKFHQSYQEELELVDDKVQKRDVALAIGKGSVTLLSDPPDATIIIDGTKYEEKTPATIAELHGGPHKVTLRVARFRDANFQIDVVPNDTVRKSVKLEGGNLVQAGDRWVLPDEATDIFIQLAREAASRGQLERTKEYLAGAKKYAQGKTIKDQGLIIDTAKTMYEKFRESRETAEEARKRGDAAMARYEKEIAIAFYETALEAYPEDELAQTGLESARNLRALGSEFSDTLKDGSAGPELIVVPPGSFTMGSPRSEAGRRNLESPQHKVTINSPFALGKYEVTFEEFDRYAKATGRSRPNDRGWGHGRRPVINIGWNDADSYTKWLSRLTGETYRLPSEAEWEYSARAGTQTAYWWGVKVESKHANCDGCNGEWADKKTLPVGSFAPNKFGLYDTAGNVFEWTLDCVNSSYKNAPNDGAAWLGGDCSRRIFRGGSWYFGPGSSRSAAREHNTRNYRSSNVGFRVLRELP